MGRDNPGSSGSDQRRSSRNTATSPRRTLVCGTGPSRLSKNRPCTVEIRPGIEAAESGFYSWPNKQIADCQHLRSINLTKLAIKGNTRNCWVKYIMKFTAIISLLAMILLGSTATALAQEKKSCSFDLVGTWKAQVSPTEAVLYRFDSNGGVTVLSASGTGGTAPDRHREIRSDQ